MQECTDMPATVGKRSREVRRALGRSGGTAAVTRDGRERMCKSALICLQLWARDREK